MRTVAAFWCPWALTVATALLLSACRSLSSIYDFAPICLSKSVRFRNTTISPVQTPWGALCCSQYLRNAFPRSQKPWLRHAGPMATAVADSMLNFHYFPSGTFDIFVHAPPQFRTRRCTPFAPHRGIVYGLVGRRQPYGG